MMSTPEAIILDNIEAVARGPYTPAEALQIIKDLIDLRN